MSEPPTKEASPPSYIVVLSGTHVTGKETIAISLSKSLDCPWLKGDQVHSASNTIARSQAKRGYDSSSVYGRTWFTKMQRIGLMSEKAESDGGGEVDNQDINKKGTACIALVSCFALRKPARDAIRDVMLAKSVRVIFVILQITRDTLSGRTLGAENPELAARIMEEKAEDLREPMEEERDVLVVDSMRDVDALILDIEAVIKRQVAEVWCGGQFSCS
jgi:gluconate kinase